MGNGAASQPTETKVERDVDLSCFSKALSQFIENADVLGLYTITHDGTRLANGPERDSTEIATLEEGTSVNILQVKAMPEIRRVRARLEDPSGNTGWMSLLNMDSGYAWAIPCNKVLQNEFAQLWNGAVKSDKTAVRSASGKWRKLQVATRFSAASLSQGLPAAWAAGTRVKVHSLVCASDLNGQYGICQRFNAREGRWNVRLDSGAERMVKPDNLEKQAVNIGTRVRIHGLVKAAELNGQGGVCHMWDASEGRWIIRLDSDTLRLERLIKPDNLRLEADKGEAAKIEVVTRSSSRVEVDGGNEQSRRPMATIATMFSAAAAGKAEATKSVEAPNPHAEAEVDPKISEKLKPQSTVAAASSEADSQECVPLVGIVTQAPNASGYPKQQGSPAAASSEKKESQESMPVLAEAEAEVFPDTSEESKVRRLGESPKPEASGIPMPHEASEESPLRFRPISPMQQIDHSGEGQSILHTPAGEGQSILLSPGAREIEEQSVMIGGPSPGAKTVDLEQEMQKIVNEVDETSPVPRSRSKESDEALMDSLLVESKSQSLDEAAAMVAAPLLTNVAATQQPSAPEHQAEIVDNPSQEQLQTSKEAAKDDNLDSAVIKDAEELLASQEHIRRVESARNSLLISEEAGELEALRDAIAAAESLGVSSSDIEAAKLSLTHLEQKESQKKIAAHELEVAYLGGDLQALQHAVNLASAASVDTAHTKVMLDLLFELEVAVDVGGVERLTEAIHAVTSAGVATSVPSIEKAFAVLKGRVEELDSIKAELGQAIASQSPEAVARSLDRAKQSKSRKSFDPAALKAAEKMVADMREAAIEASKELAAAQESGDLERMKIALEAAAAAHVDAETITAAQAALAEAEARHAATKAACKKLDAAMQSTDAALLQEALDEAKARGVDSERIASGEDALAKLKAHLAAVAEATATLEQAIQKAAEDLEGLSTALAAAEGIGVAQDLLSTARAAWAREQRKKDVRKELVAAAEVLDLTRLRAAIESATAAGISEGDALRNAQETLRVEEAKESAKQELRVALDTDTPSYDQLRNALKRAADAGVPSVEELVVSAQKALERLQAQKEALATLQAAFAAGKSDRIDYTDPEALESARDKLLSALLACRSLGMGDSMEEVAVASRLRRHLHNTLQDLKGATRVFCRVRPLSKREKDLRDKEVVYQVGGMSIEVLEEDSHGHIDNNASREAKPLEPHRFEFDAAFGADSTQEQIFSECRDLVQSVIDGYNITIFAYGQTGAGKTFTMMGAESPPELRGVCPRTVEAIFQAIEQHSMRFEFKLEAYMVEVYCSKLNDLAAKARGIKDSDIKVQYQNNEVIMDGVLAVEIKTAEDLFKLIREGNDAKKITATAMNPGSSRSHTILSITVKCTNRETSRQHHGKILLVDLAGCERLKKSQAEGEAKKEAIEINKSLTCLGDVISAVTLGKRVPYRNHILTKIMQDSLGGTAKTLMFVNVSPAESNVSETVMALKFACRAKTITRQEAAATKIQAVYHGAQDRALVRSMSQVAMTAALATGKGANARYV